VLSEGFGRLMLIMPLTCHDHDGECFEKTHIIVEASAINANRKTCAARLRQELPLVCPVPSVKLGKVITFILMANKYSDPIYSVFQFIHYRYTVYHG